MAAKVHAMKKGDRVRITSGQLGLMSHPESTRFVSETLNYGEEAEYDGPHDNPELAEKGWVMLTVVRDGATLWCPVHDSMWERPSAVRWAVEKAASEG